MKRCQRLPFGAECEDGGVRFRLWAPRATQVDVQLFENGSRPVEAGSIPMNRLPDGWFEVVSPQAGPGALYQFHVDGRISVPDPASRFQPRDVHGPSEVIDPTAFDWQDAGWNGRPWKEAVIYELHVGAFTPEGTFAGLETKLDYLAKLGVTAVELMPIADFSGSRNWGYDGVLPYAPDSSYGRPEDLKRLIQQAHARGLMIFLDVVYNHFGPDGNYLREYAPQFFTERHHTPWGEGINFDGPGCRQVRDYFIHNALYWLNEYRFDGLRFDAVHAILDDSKLHILTELAEKVRSAIPDGRHVHLVLENDDNAAHYLNRDGGGHATLYNAQWNDDFHHALHTALTGEKDGYYSDYIDAPAQHLGRCLAQGFAYQGEASPHRGGRRRGEPSLNLPPTAFVPFLQNHDQVGNRAFGDRIRTLVDPRALQAAMTVVLLAPSPPLLFMGEEFGADTPFLFFCDFGPDLARAVTQGRRREFARFARFSSPTELATIPDPGAESTFMNSRLDWNSLCEPGQQDWLEFYRHLLALREREIIPRISNIETGTAAWQTLGSQGVTVHWKFVGGGGLSLIANLGDEPFVLGGQRPSGILLYASEATEAVRVDEGQVPAHFAAWYLTQ